MTASHLEKEIFCLQSICSIKAEIKPLYVDSKASFSFHFLPVLFDFWQKNGETLSRNVFVEAGGSGCSGSSVPEHLTSLLTAPQGVFLNMSTLQAPSSTL